MKLSLKLAMLNVRRYPLRTLGSAVCLIIFGFSVFSALLFTNSLSETVSEVLKSRSSGNTVVVKTNIGEIETISKNPDILETLPYYWSDFVSGYIAVEDIGEFDINLFYEQAPDSGSLIPKTFFDEFFALGEKNFLVKGRMPESSGEMIICESWFKKAQIKDYDEFLNKQITFSHDFTYDERIIDIENGKIVGVFSEDFVKINSLNSYIDWADVGFLINSDSRYNFITAYCSIEKIDKVYEQLCEKYGGDKVIKTVLSNPAIKKLSGLNMFIGNLMFLAVCAVALIYVSIRLVSISNYIKEKSLFVTAADAFGCEKRHIFGSFVIENITLMIPSLFVSWGLGCAFVKILFELVSMYVGIELDIRINFGFGVASFALMILIELLSLSVSLLLLRKKEND